MLRNGRVGSNGWRARILCGAAALATAALAAAAGAEAERSDSGFARGVVFRDSDRDGVRDAGEWGVRGVAVSNGREVVRSDWRGRYRIAVDDDTALFVIKPRGYATPVSAERLPRFYYLHKPSGSPSDLAHPGVAPTGPLPDTIDFPLIRSREPDAFRMLLFGDTQPYTLEELGFLSHDVIEPLIGADVAFGMTLGDLVGDDLSLFEPLNRAIAQIGVPWYNALGNHDMNFRARNDADSDDSFERVYGPPTYAFQVGRVHFVVLDDVIYEGWNDAENRRGRYREGLTDDQLAFVRNYLAGVPRRDLVVLALHIPIGGLERHQLPQRRALFEALAAHPHTLSLSAHTHIQYHHFFGQEDGLAAGRTHHHLNQATTCGSWWLGALDELGIPHATMRDGAPNGYSIVHFDGNAYRVEFRAARRPADYQMNVIAPEAVRAESAGSTEVLVNVFAGSERSSVEMRLGVADAWRPLQRVLRADPLYEEVVAREGDATRRRDYALPSPEASRHLWRGTLPENPPRGTAALEVRTRDMFGQVYSAHRLIRIE
ncbi:MAG: calcineurin-like phosphoesterase family protein [Myxococcales bacterium]|nr:calcineurin-like phosphoesterase family protein [Myxococcales bacterium]MDH5565082.1 calcineurin-like phosphoesterase family protein [Myxococcales bacterium]